MKIHAPVTGSQTADESWPDAAALAALRAWYEGLDSRTAVLRYLGERRGIGESSRGLLSLIRRQVADFARSRHRADLAVLFEQSGPRNARRAAAIAKALDILPRLPVPQPQIGDAVERWLPLRAATALQAAGIKTLADLTVRVPRRRRWWVPIARLGMASARRIERFFAAHPRLTERARSLVVIAAPQDVRPWECIAVPHDVNGSRGNFRAPRAACVLRADNDYEAVQAWLSLHESPATQRAYRKEAERLLLS